MEKRIATLEEVATQTNKSIACLEASISEVSRGIADLRKDIDRKFTWCISVQFAVLIAIICLLSKIGNLF